MIGDYEATSILNKIKENHLSIKEIRESLIDQRVKYREFAQIIGLDELTLTLFIPKIEETLLIQIYTLSEQLTKNFYYHLLGSNCVHVDNFVKSKIPDSKFSPNVNFKEIQKAIKQDLISDFRFMLSDSNDIVKSYNNLVDTRHRYAHKGEYTFEFDKFIDCIKVVEYILFEYKMYIDFGHNLMIQSEFNVLKMNIENIYKKIKNLDYNNDKQLKKVKDITVEELNTVRTNSIRFLKEYKQYLESLGVFDEFLEVMSEFNNTDFRKKHEKFINIKRLKQCIDQL